LNLAICLQSRAELRAAQRIEFMSKIPKEHRAGGSLVSRGAGENLGRKDLTSRCSLKPKSEIDSDNKDRENWKTGQSMRDGRRVD
jgi:hypothetical protein